MHGQKIKFFDFWFKGTSNNIIPTWTVVYIVIHKNVWKLILNRKDTVLNPSKRSQVSLTPKLKCARAHAHARARAHALTHETRTQAHTHPKHVCTYAHTQNTHTHADTHARAQTHNIYEPTFPVVELHKVIRFAMGNSLSSEGIMLRHETWICYFAFAFSKALLCCCLFFFSLICSSHTFCFVCPTDTQWCQPTKK